MIQLVFALCVSFIEEAETLSGNRVYISQYVTILVKYLDVVAFCVCFASRRDARVKPITIIGGRPPRISFSPENSS